MNDEPKTLEDMVQRYGRAVVVVDDESDGLKVMGAARAHSVDMDGKPKKGTKRPAGDGFIPEDDDEEYYICLLYTSPSPRDLSTSRMPSSA